MVLVHKKFRTFNGLRLDWTGTILWDTVGLLGLMPVWGGLAAFRRDVKLEAR